MRWRYVMAVALLVAAGGLAVAGFERAAPKAGASVTASRDTLELALTTAASLYDGYAQQAAPHIGDDLVQMSRATRLGEAFKQKSKDARALAAKIEKAGSITLKN